jgi:molybdate transport system permease protein
VPCVLRDAPSRALLRMRKSLNAIESIPHAEERSKSASRSTQSVNAASSDTLSSPDPSGARLRHSPPNDKVCRRAIGIDGDGVFDFTADEAAAIRLSLRVAVWAMLGSLPFGIAAAVVLARSRFWGKSLIDGVIHLPLVMPPVVTGYLLLLLLGRHAPLGRFLADDLGIVFAFRWTGAALASAVMGFPLLVRAIRLSVEAVDRRLEEAASTLGAGPVPVFVLVTLPLTAPGILAGMVLSFARSLGEFGATITFVSSIPGVTRTVPSAIYAYLQVPGGDAPALRLTVASIAISLVALVFSDLLARRLGRRLSGE